jgi:hypothetical protein
VQQNDARAVSRAGRNGMEIDPLHSEYDMLNLCLST